MRLFRRNAIGFYAVYAAAMVSGLVVTPILLQVDRQRGVRDLGVHRRDHDLPGRARLRPRAVGRPLHGRGARTPRSGGDQPRRLGRARSLRGDRRAHARRRRRPRVVRAAADRDAAATSSGTRGSRRSSSRSRSPSASRSGSSTTCSAAGTASTCRTSATSSATVLYAVLVALLIPRGGGLVLLGLLTILVTVLRLGLPLIWLRRELPELQLRRAYVTRDGMRDLVGVSWSNFLVHVANKVVFSTDVVVVGIVLGAERGGVLRDRLEALPARVRPGQRGDLAALPGVRRVRGVGRAGATAAAAAVGPARRLCGRARARAAAAR